MSSINIVLVGDSGVGKTTWINKVSEKHSGSISSKSYIHPIKIYGNDINVWDICNNEKHYKFLSDKNNRNFHYDNAHGVIVMYDAQNENSLINAHNWYAEIQQASPGLSVLFVANKWNEMGDVQFRCEELCIYEYARWIGMSLKYKMYALTTPIEWFIPILMECFY